MLSLASPQLFCIQSIVVACNLLVTSFNFSGEGMNQESCKSLLNSSTMKKSRTADIRYGSSCSSAADSVPSIGNMRRSHTDHIYNNYDNNEDAYRCRNSAYNNVSAGRKQSSAHQLYINAAATTPPSCIYSPASLAPTNCCECHPGTCSIA